MPGPRDYARYQNTGAKNSTQTQSSSQTVITLELPEGKTLNDVLLEGIARKNHCERLHDAYDDPRNKGGCGNATTCEEVKEGIKRMQRQLSLRSKYMDNFCDIFDWSHKTGKPDKTFKEKYESHVKAIENTKDALKNCWQKWAELGCCCPEGE